MRFIAASFIIFLSAVNAAAQSRNAADSYRIAGRNLPAAVNEDEGFVLKNTLDAPLDDAAKKLVERAAKSLDMFDVASKMPFGTWGYDLNEAMTAGRLLPNASELADMVILRARLRAAAGDKSALLDESYKLLLLARRMSVQPSLPRQLQQNALFDKANQLSGLGMLDASPDDLKTFADKLDELRSPPDPIDVIESEERAYLLYHQKLVEDPYLRRIADEGIGPFNSLFGVKLQPVDVSDLLVDEQSMSIAFAETERAFADVISALKVPLADRPAELQAAHLRVRSSHALARTAMQVADECLRAGQLHEMQMNLLRVALNICSDPQRPVDPDRARSLALAYRFDFQPTETGFTLKWRDQGQLNPPMSIQVGTRPVRVAPIMVEATTQPAAH